MAEHTTAQTRRRRGELVRRAAQAGDAADVFAAASSRLRDLVPFDASAWVTTDPATGLPAGPTRLEEVHGISAGQCSEHWRREFVVDDVNLFRDIARADVPAAGLRATVGDPGDSGRYRSFIRPLGFDDELRAVLRVGKTPWGSVTLWRRRGQPPFSEQDVALVAGLSASLGEALRAHVRPAGERAAVVHRDRPGLMTFDAAGGLLSVDEQALAWLDELPPERGVPTDLGVDLPMWLIVAVLHAGAVASGSGDGTARARVRSRRGRWLTCHASCLRRGDGSFGDIAVVLEPAQPAELVPIIVEAFDLTAREQDVVRLIVRGAGTAEVADELYLSRHTVRDHVKTILRKVGVSSRGELVAKLFAEHYLPAHMGGVVRADADGADAA
jgi:DNA-binding CsgD family transcriptional regulator